MKLDPKAIDAAAKLVFGTGADGSDRKEISEIIKAYCEAAGVVMVPVISEEEREEK